MLFCLALYLNLLYNNMWWLKYYINYRRNPISEIPVAETDQFLYNHAPPKLPVP
jgi:hypothetical protein